MANIDSLTVTLNIDDMPIKGLHKLIEESSKALSLFEQLLDDDSFSFYHSAIEINTHTTSLDGELIRERMELLRMNIYQALFMMKQSVNAELVD